MAYFKYLSTILCLLCITSIASAQAGLVEQSDNLGSSRNINYPCPSTTAAIDPIQQKFADFSQIETEVIWETKKILKSIEMTTIRQAQATKQSVTVNIDGRMIQYEPGLPASGMTMFGENGFLIGREAFAIPGELERTILHELYRLNTSAAAEGVSAELAAQETKAAADFAERAAKRLGL